MLRAAPMTADLVKTVLVTGASHRVGRALALDFAAQGWRVGVHYGHSKPAADAVVGEITARGGRAAALAADLSDEKYLLSLVDRCRSALGAPVTCLVNNASLFEADDAPSMTPESWNRHLAVNLKAPVFLAQALYRGLAEDAEANVINIIDQRVWRLTPDFFSYTIAKAGLWTATRTLAQALAPRVRVNAIGPGPVLQSIHQSPEDFAEEAASTPLGRGTSPDEIAAAVRFILASAAMTGQMIALDGGQHLDWRAAGVTAGAGKQKS